MKKRILSLFFVLCMVLSVSVTVSFATGEGSETVVVPEQACEGTTSHESDDWIEIPAGTDIKDTLAATTSTDTKKFYLAGDVTMSDIAKIYGDVTLCLNGKTVTVSRSTTASVVGIMQLQKDCKFTLCDCSVSDTNIHGTGKIIHSEADNNARLFHLSSYSGMALTIQGGTISGFDARQGSIVYQASSSSNSFTLSGGHLTGTDNSEDAVMLSNRTSGDPTAYPGGAVYITYGTFTMEGGEISGITTGSGAVYLATAKTSTISGGTIAGNTATGGTLTVVTTEDDPGTTDVNEEVTKTVTLPAYGGGIYVANGTVNISGGTITGNTAVNGGGIYVADGTVNISGGTIGSNTATFGGGGICQAAGTIAISGGTITGNKAASVSESDGGGGGVLVNGTFAMSGGTISDNEGRSGGGVYITNGTVTVDGGSIDNNDALYGGGVRVSKGAFTMSSGSVSSNTAVSGGGLYVNGGTTVTLSGGKVDYNKATDNTTIATDKNWLGGGILTSSSSTVSLSGDVSVSYNAADTNGGGIYATGTTNISENASIFKNEATNGGGIYLNTSSSALNMVNGVVSTNTATTNGGGLYSMGDASITGGTFTNNTANAGGGAYLSNSRASTIKNVSFTLNSAKANGSALYYNNGKADQAHVLTNVTVKNNSASGEGAIYLNGSSATNPTIVKITDCTVTENKSTAGSFTGGVAVYVSVTGGATAEIYGASHIYDNTLNGVNTNNLYTRYTNDAVSGNIGFKIYDGFFDGTFNTRSSAKTKFQAYGGRYKEKPSTVSKLSDANFLGSGVMWAEDGANEEFPWVVGTACNATVAETVTNGTLNIEPATTVKGVTVTVQAVPDEGYLFAGTIYVNGNPIEGKTFPMPEGGAVVSAEFMSRPTGYEGYVIFDDDFSAYDIGAFDKTKAMENQGYTSTTGCDSASIAADEGSEDQYFVGTAGTRYYLANAGSVLDNATYVMEASVRLQEGCGNFTMRLGSLPDDVVKNTSGYGTNGAVRLYVNGSSGIYLKHEISGSENHFANQYLTANGLSTTSSDGIPVGYNKWWHIRVEVAPDGNITVTATDPGSISYTGSIDLGADMVYVPNGTGWLDLTQAGKTADLHVDNLKLYLPDAFAVKVTQPENGGTVTVDKAYGLVGDTVSVTVKPAANYALGTLTANTTDDITTNRSFEIEALADGNEVTANFVLITSGMELTIADYADGAPTTDDGYFAGWYKDNNYETAVEDTTGVEKAYAKFVDKAVLGLMKQIKTKATTTDLRLVSSVDGLNYENVGFEITFNGVTQDKSTTSVYEKILADGEYVDTSVFETEDSRYFMTFTITGIPESAYGTDFTVKPYWTTLDGTKVYGEAEDLTIDGLAPASN